MAIPGRTKQLAAALHVRARNRSKICGGLYAQPKQHLHQLPVCTLQLKLHHFKRAALLNPLHADANINWGVALSMQGRNEEALKARRPALRNARSG